MIGRKASKEKSRLKLFLALAGFCECLGVAYAAPRFENLQLGQVLVAPEEQGTASVKVSATEGELAGVSTVLTLFALDGTTLHAEITSAAPEATFTIPPLPEGAHRIVVRLQKDGRTLDSTENVYSVVSNPADDIRYGFYTRFAATGEDYAAKARILTDLHLNAMEFYDYFPGHGDYAPTQEQYPNAPFYTQTIQVSNIQNKIASSRARNIASIAYIAAYSAISSIAENVPDYLLNQWGEPLVFYEGNIGTEEQLGGVWFRLMAFAPDTLWFQYIMDELESALDDSPADKVSFDGFEVDTYGSIGDYYSNGSSWNGEQINEVLEQFTAELRDLTQSIRPKGMVATNTINEDGILGIYDAVDFLFVENWSYHKPHYDQVVDMVYWNGAVRGQRLVSKSYPADTTLGVQAWPAVNLRLLMGAHITGGGSFMVAGEPEESSGRIGGLNSLYYPDYQLQSQENQNIIRNYNRHDAALYLLNHGPGVERKPNDFSLGGCIVREFENERGDITICILRNEENERWTELNTSHSTRYFVPVTYTLPNGVTPVEVMFATPDNSTQIYPAPIDWSVDKDRRLTFKLPSLQYLSTVVIRTSTPEARLHDSAGNSNYDGGWNDGDSGGFGWSTPWALSPRGETAGGFAGDSTKNGNGSSNPDDDINTAGRAWGLYASSGELPQATRTFPELQVGESLRIQLDTGYIEGGGSAGFGLQNGSGKNVLEFYFVGGEGSYITKDAAGDTPRGIDFTDEGLDIEIRLTAPDEYAARVYPISAGESTVSFTGELLSPASGQEISVIRLFLFSAGTGPQYDTFFNNISIYSGTPSPGELWILY